MKVDQIAEGILFRQMTAARIGESGNPKLKTRVEDNPEDSSRSGLDENIQSEGNKKEQELQNYFTEFQNPEFYK
jgi:hypothetical protein